jgi:tRNA(Ile)-lysidine synthase
MIRTYATVRLVPRSADVPAPREFSVPLRPAGITELPDAGFIFDASLAPVADLQFPRDPFVTLFDAADLGRGLHVRNFHPGDRIRPLGMHGTRKVKDVFIDRKVARRRRPTWPVVMLGDEIVWLPGLARGRASLVTERTQNALKVIAREIAL